MRACVCVCVWRGGSEAERKRRSRQVKAVKRRAEGCRRGGASLMRPQHKHEVRPFRFPLRRKGGSGGWVRMWATSSHWKGMHRAAARPSFSFCPCVFVEQRLRRRPRSVFSPPVRRRDSPSSAGQRSALESRNREKEEQSTGKMRDGDESEDGGGRVGEEARDGGGKVAEPIYIYRFLSASALRIADGHAGKARRRVPSRLHAQRHTSRAVIASRGNKRKAQTRRSREEGEVGGGQYRLPPLPGAAGEVGEEEKQRRGGERLDRSHVTGHGGSSAVRVRVFDGERG